MKKSLLIALLFLIAASDMVALPVNMADADRVAHNFITKRTGANYMVTEPEALDSGYQDSYRKPGEDNINSGRPAVIGNQPGILSTNLSEDFEGTAFPPIGWTNSIGTSFSRSSINKITGSYSARYNETNSGDAQSGKQLRTAKVTVDIGSYPLKFKAWTGNVAQNEQINVGYSTSATGPYTYFPTIASLTSVVQTFTYATSGLNHGDYYFVFETYCFHTTSASRSWIIDNVTGPILWVDPALPTPEAPVLTGIVNTPSGITISWNTVDNAVRYNVYGCNDLSGTYALVGTVEGGCIELTDAALADIGISSHGFFYVKTDFGSRNSKVQSVQNKNSPPLLPIVQRAGNTRRLNSLQ